MNTLNLEESPTSSKSPSSSKRSISQDSTTAAQSTNLITSPQDIPTTPTTDSDTINPTCSPTPPNCESNMNKAPTPPWVSGAAGVFSGFLATLLLHPLEVLKIRMQGDVRTNYRFSIREVIQISRQVGLYTGVSANALASMIAWGVFFGANEKLRQVGREMYSQRHPDAPLTGPPAPHFGIDFTSSIIASASAQILTNPLWLMKTRMSLDQIPLSQATSTSTTSSTSLSSKQSFASSSHLTINANSPYRNLFRGLQHVSQTEGIRGLYKGFSASLLGSTHGAIMMCTYQFVKEGQTPWLIGLLPDFLQPIILSTYAAFASKAVATVVTYPTQVIRTAIQDHRYSTATLNAPPTPAAASAATLLASQYGISHATRDIYSSSGFFGFYRGMSMQIVRASLQNVIVFGIYESFKTFFVPQTPSLTSPMSRSSNHKD